MPPRILQLVREGRVQYSRKARLIFLSLALTPGDIAVAILEGRVSKRERDETGQARFKYTIVGPAKSGRKVYCAGKILRSQSGAVFFVMTAHWTRPG